MLEAAALQLDELAREARAYQDGLETDPQRLADVERRRDLLYRLTRKYGGSLDAVAATLQDSRRELDLVDTAKMDLAALRQREAQAVAALGAAAKTLSDLRVRAAKRLQAEVQRILPDLGMPDGRLAVAVRQRPVIARHGAEDVEFLVTLNVGHEARPLTRVASGGELARVMLALSTILARQDRVPTLVFDEVDSGIGGAVGLAVGDTLRRVAEHHQVFVVTHLAQIASRAHRHVVVAKGAKGGVTTADVHVVDGDARVQEVARMLGGDAASVAGRRHARELLGAVDAR
jgi:DNA repair protein RecN (Recombination protein N)